MDDKLFNALSLCKKAGALTAGFDAVKERGRKGEIHLLLFAADLSAATQKRILTVCNPQPKLLQLSYTQDAIAALTGKPVGLLAVTNQDLAVLVQKAAAQSA